MASAYYLASVNPGLHTQVPLVSVGLARTKVPLLSVVLQERQSVAAVPAAVAHEGSLVRSVKAEHVIRVELKTKSAKQTSHLAAPFTAQLVQLVEQTSGQPKALVAEGA